MDPYEYHELHDRWDSLMVRMIRLFARLDIRVEEQDCGLEDRKSIVKLIHEHGLVETNLKMAEPKRCDLYEHVREELDDVEALTLEHLEDCAKYVN
jgi:hypothetical protein